MASNLTLGLILVSPVLGNAAETLSKNGNTVSCLQNTNLRESSFVARYFVEIAFHLKSLFQTSLT